MDYNDWPLLSIKHDTKNYSVLSIKFYGEKCAVKKECKSIFVKLSFGGGVGGGELGVWDKLI